MEANNSDEAIDLRIINQIKTNASASNNPDTYEGRRNTTISSGKLKKHHVNVFRKHKLKYRYLWKRQKPTSDSGNFGSSSMVGSSSTTGSIEKKSTADESTSSPCTSTSPLSGNSTSPQNFPNLDVQADQQMCMMLGHAVPLIVMVQGQIQTTNTHNSDYSITDTMLYKCNMCNMFCNSLADVLSHVHGNHRNISYCFVCNQFFNSKTDFERHKDVCATTRQAFQQMVGGNYHSNNQLNSQNNTQEQALNLTVVGDVAKRAAQIVLNKKGSKKRQNKLKKLQKCTYCKKAFFGQFYLQRHMRSHTGEKLCHCHLCGKGFVECRNLRNHMTRFHNSSESISSGSRKSKSISPNNTSDSEYKNGKDSKSKRKSNMSSKNSYNTSATTFLDSTLSKQINTLQTCQTWTTESSAYNSRSNHDINAPSTSGMQNSNGSKESCNPTFDRSWSAPSSTNSLTSHSEYYNSFSSMVTQCTNSAPDRTLLDPTSNDSVAPQTIQAEDTRMTEDGRNTSLTYLGSTSSRLELNSGQSGQEKSLLPIPDGQGGKIFRCHVCEKTFRTRFAMQRHLDFHADKRPFHCEQCNYRAKTRPQLKVHVMRHSGQKGFNCSTCNYSCVTHSDLNRHCKSRSHLFRTSILEQKQTAVGVPTPLLEVEQKDASIISQPSASMIDQSSICITSQSSGPIANQLSAPINNQPSVPITNQTSAEPTDDQQI